MRQPRRYTAPSVKDNALPIFDQCRFGFPDRAGGRSVEEASRQTGKPVCASLRRQMLSCISSEDAPIALYWPPDHHKVCRTGLRHLALRTLPVQPSTESVKPPC